MIRSATKMKGEYSEADQPRVCGEHGGGGMHLTPMQHNIVQERGRQDRGTTRRNNAYIEDLAKVGESLYCQASNDW